MKQRPEWRVAAHTVNEQLERGSRSRIIPWRRAGVYDDVSYEEAAADLLHHAEIERIAQHDGALIEWHRFEDEEPF